MFYIWTATNGTYSFNFHNVPYRQYNLLADSFFRGRLDLPVKVPAGLLALPNPYDPTANREYRWKGFHDVSLYKGKIYFYFGPTPVVTLYMPYRFLTKLAMPDNFASMFFMYGVFIWGALLLFHLKNKYFQQLPEWILLTAISVLAFANIGPFLSRNPAIYEIAVSSACFFLTGAVYFLCKAVSSEETNLKMLKIGSLFLGLATGGRFYFLIASILLILLIFLEKSKTNFNIGNIFKTNFGKSLILPFLICLLILFAYNYVRFDNIFENGNKYQVTSFNAKFFSLASIVPNLYSYFLQPPTISSTFPFIYANHWRPPFMLSEGLERIIGLPLGVPFLLLLFFAPVIFLIFRFRNIKSGFKNNVTFPGLEFKIIFLAAAVNLLSVIGFQYVTMRYLGDFLTLLILSTCIIWFYFDSMLIDKTSGKLIFRSIVVILSAVSIIFGTAFSITGHIFGLKHLNPTEYQKLELFFMPVSKLLSKIIS